MELLPISIGIGLAVSLIFSETFGLAAGGMVVPGYIALRLTNVADVAVTLGVGLLTYLIVRSLSSFVIVFGRRRTVLMILIGYALGMAVRWGTRGLPAFGGNDFDVIGFIIPGLIAIWFDRQGFVETTCALVTASAVVRLALVLLVGMEM